MSEDKELFRKLCEEEKSICIYEQAWWLDIDCGPDNWDVVLSFSNNRIVGALPFYTKKSKGFKYITIPFRSQHHGPWIKEMKDMSPAKKLSHENTIMSDLIDKIEAIAKKQKIVFFNQCFSPNITNWLPFYWKHYKQTTLYTYRIQDIRNPELVLNSFESGKRYNIKNAIKKGIIIKEDLSPNDFYSFHKKVVEKKGKHIKYSFDMFQSYYNGLYKHNQGKCLYAVNSNGVIEGAILVAYDSSWGYDWITAFDSGAKSSGSSDLLVFSAIKFLSNKTIGFDFEGSMDQGIEHSYRHFGTVQTPYFKVSKIYRSKPFIKLFLSKKARF